MRNRTYLIGTFKQGRVKLPETTVAVATTGCMAVATAQARLDLLSVQLLGSIGLGAEGLVCALVPLYRLVVFEVTGCEEVKKEEATIIMTPCLMPHFLPQSSGPFENVTGDCRICLLYIIH